MHEGHAFRARRKCARAVCRDLQVTQTSQPEATAPSWNERRPEPRGLNERRLEQRRLERRLPRTTTSTTTTPTDDDVNDDDAKDDEAKDDDA
jgi:hypothetical protein